MLHITDYLNEDKIFEALDSKVRRQILYYLIEEGPKNLDELARALGVTNGALTAHIKLLEQVGLIKTQLASGKHGLRKQCIINTSRVVIDLLPKEQISEKTHEIDVAIGTYCDYSVISTCGLASKDGMIGEYDEPKYFAYPERTNAALLWFSTGYVEYLIPNLIAEGERLVELQFVFEIASEAPGYMEHYPSDVYFWLNGICLGSITIAGERNDRRGLFTPDWWDRKLGQYGYIQILSISEAGVSMNGYDIYPIDPETGKERRLTLKDFRINGRSDLKFKFSVPENTKNRGGLNLFGKGFGDYNRGITCKFICSSNNEKPQG